MNHSQYCPKSEKHKNINTTSEPIKARVCICSELKAILEEALESIIEKPWTHDNWMAVDERAQAIEVIKKLVNNNNL
jgi:hypothetical protein